MQLAGKPSLRWTRSPPKCAFATGQQTQSKVDSLPKCAFATGRQKSTVYSPPKCLVRACLCHWPASPVHVDPPLRHDCQPTNGGVTVWTAAPGKGALIPFTSCYHNFPPSRIHTPPPPLPPTPPPSPPHLQSLSFPPPSSSSLTPLPESPFQQTCKASMRIDFIQDVRPTSSRSPKPQTQRQIKPEADAKRRTDRLTHRQRDRETDNDRERQRDRDRENSNSKTSFYKDCSLGSVKNLFND